MKRAVVAAVAAALVLAACGGGGGKKTASSSSSSTIAAGDTSTSAAAASTTVAGGATATTKPAGTTATTKPATVNGQPASNYTPPAGSTAAKPAAPGTYHYDNQSTGMNTFGPPPAVSPLIVDAPQGTRQHATNDMTSGGKGSITETTLDFKPEGVYLVEIKLTTKTAFGNQTLDFIGSPPPLAAPTGVAPGQHVDFALTSNPPGTTIQVHIDFVRMETITIGGQPVNTMVIHQVATLSGNFKGTQTADSWVSPQYDLFVKTHAVADITSPVAAHTDETSTLEKLTPG
jgi:hypothetical protein